jgi:hypothetical protein
MNFSCPCRDWIVLVEPSQHCVLGYTQPSLQDRFANGVLTRALWPLRDDFPAFFEFFRSILAQLSQLSCESQVSPQGIVSLS